MRKLFKEHYNQRKFKNYYYCEPSIASMHKCIKFYYTFILDSYKSQARRNKICGINRLAKENIASCSAVVKAVSNFFLKTDPRQNFCYPTSYKPRFH